MDVAVVLPQEEIEPAEECRRERDVGERPADEVVAALHRPVDQVMQAERHEHADRVSPSYRDRPLLASLTA